MQTSKHQSLIIEVLPRPSSRVWASRIISITCVQIVARKPFQLEFVLKCSPTILWELLTTSSGLANWFADSVDEDNGTLIFDWSGSKETARVLESNEPELFRLRMVNSPKGEYIEFRIASSEVTGDTILYVTDFADDSDLEDQRILWESQIATLASRIGG